MNVNISKKAPQVLMLPLVLMAAVLLWFVVIPFAVIFHGLYSLTVWARSAYSRNPMDGDST